MWGEKHRGQNLLLSSAVIEQNEDKTQFKFRNHNIYTTCEPLHCTNHNHKVRVWGRRGEKDNHHITKNNMLTYSPEKVQKSILMSLTLN